MTDLKELSLIDHLFLECVTVDVQKYLTSLETSSNSLVLVFPPVNNYRRFLIHQVVQENFSWLGTVSIGRLYGRRIVLYKPMDSLIKQKKVDGTNKIVDTEVIEEKTPSKPSGKLPSKELYRPPGRRIRDANTENTSSSSESKSSSQKKRDDVKLRNRRPDMQIYIPKAKRILLTEEENNDPKIINPLLVENSNLEEDDGKDDDILIIEDHKDPIEIIDLELIPNIEPISSIDSNISEKTDFHEYTEFDDNAQKESNRVVLNRSKFKANRTTADEKIELNSNRTNDIDCRKLLLNYDDGSANMERKFSNIDVNFECDSEKNTNLEIQNERAAEDFLSESVEDSINMDIVNNSDENLVPLEEISQNQDVLEKNDIESQGNNYLVKNLNFGNWVRSASDEAIRINNAAVAVNLTVDDHDWEELFDNNENYLDKNLMRELTSALGNVSVKHATENYHPFQTLEERSTDGECIIELYGFPVEFKTGDLLAIFSDFQNEDFQISWVDDTHALAVFSSPITADRALNTQFSFIKTRPLKEATAKSRNKAKMHISAPVNRPQTCVTIARRLVEGALGVKIGVTETKRRAERKLLSDAREKKKLDAIETKRKSQQYWEDDK